MASNERNGSRGGGKNVCYLIYPAQIEAWSRLKNNFYEREWERINVKTKNYGQLTLSDLTEMLVLNLGLLNDCATIGWWSENCNKVLYRENPFLFSLIFNLKFGCNN